MSFPATLGSALKKEGGCGRCYDEDKHNLSKNKRQSGELTPRSPNFNGAATIPRRYLFLYIKGPRERAVRGGLSGGLLVEDRIEGCAQAGFVADQRPQLLLFAGVVRFGNPETEVTAFGVLFPQMCKTAFEVSLAVECGAVGTDRTAPYGGARSRGRCSGRPRRRCVRRSCGEHGRTRPGGPRRRRA